MKRFMSGFLIIVVLFVLVVTSFGMGRAPSASDNEKKSVNRQQAIYQKEQPLPTFWHSLERGLLIIIYMIRNSTVSTHTVWRSNTGVIEGDCTSIGYGIPYDASLSNPWQAVGGAQGKTSIGMAEPNGIFASQNTSATWAMCVSPDGDYEPMYIETKVTVYPYLVNVDYNTNRVTRAGKSNIRISKDLSDPTLSVRGQDGKFHKVNQ